MAAVTSRQAIRTAGIAELRRSFIRGAFWSVLAALASQGGTFLAAVVAAHLLGREAFGALALVQNTALMMASVAGAGLGICATTYAGRLGESDPVRTGRVLGLLATISLVTALAFALALAGLAPWLARVVFGAPELSPGLRISSVAVLFLTLNGFQTGALVGLQAFPALAWSGAVQGFVSIAATIVLTSQWRITGAVAAFCLSSALLWALSQAVLRKECRRRGIDLSRGWRLPEYTLIPNFLAPAALAGIIGQIAIWAASALLSRRPGGLEQMGIFSAGLVFRQIVLFAPSISSRVALPLLCHIRVSAQRSVYLASVRDSVVLNAMLALLAAAALAAGAPWILSSIGRGFTAARPVMSLLLASAVVEVIAVALYQPVLGAGKIWWHVAVLCGWASCVMAGGILSAARTDASVLAGAYVAAWLLSAVAYGVMTRRLVTTDEFSRG